jgi:hypothetical protein
MSATTPTLTIIYMLTHLYVRGYGWYVQLNMIVQRIHYSPNPSGRNVLKNLGQNHLMTGMSTTFR